MAYNLHNSFFTLLAYNTSEPPACFYCATIWPLGNWSSLCTLPLCQFFSRRKDIAIDRRVITKRDCLFPLRCSGYNSWKGNMKLASNKICILRNVFGGAFFGGVKTMILLPLQLRPCYNRPAVIIYRQINLSNLSEPLTTIWFSANWIINVT